VTAGERARTERNAHRREHRRLLRLHRFEDDARSRGFLLLGGIDEVGRGPLAGPVVAACVVADGPLMIRGLDDSKRVKPQLRTELAEIIKMRAVAWAIGEASVAEIDALNIYRASILAMERALAALCAQPEYLLTDAVRIRSFAGEQLPVIKGDAKCATVAAASIVAKVHRDRLLVDLDAAFPHYGFAEHKGYATPQHLRALREHGPCELHRRNWWHVRESLTLFGQLSADDLGDVVLE
jgi:ribonuclease HII